MRRPAVLAFAHALPCLLIAACGDAPAKSVTLWVEHPHALVIGAGTGPLSGDVTAPDTADSAGTATTIADATTTADTHDPNTDALSDTGPVSDDVTVALHPATYPRDRIHSPITPSIVRRLQAIRGVDPDLADDVFMKVGASTTASASFLKCFATSALDLGVYTHLQPTLDYFMAGDADGTDPFSRKTLAAKSGVSASWAIAGDPSPLEAEYLAIGPTIAFVHYGTNDMGMGSTYESALWGFAENLWTLTDDLLAWGVVPVLGTIVRRLDSTAADAWVPTYNHIVAGLAQGRQIPLFDAYLAYEPLPNHGIAGDGIHGTTYSGGACKFTPEGLAYSLNVRNLETLVALDRLGAAMRDGEALDPPGDPVTGVGIVDDPIVIAALPFSDVRTTDQATSDAFDRYDGCDASADESGPEVVYTLTLAAPTRIRALVADRDGVDIDLHLLDDSGTVDGCLARAHRLIDADLEPGTYYFVLDTFVSQGVPQAGEYLFAVFANP